VTHIFAYLDPGSSSMIIQMLLGGFAAAGVALKLYWTKFKRLLGIKPKEDQQVETAGGGLYQSEASEPVKEPAGSSKS
jgi:hypothetical protein